MLRNRQNYEAILEILSTGFERNNLPDGKTQQLFD